MNVDRTEENQVLAQGETMNIDLPIAHKVLETVRAGLVSGKGVPEPGKMCVEAAVCYAMGLPHGDEPTCVSPALRQLKIRLNDSRWSSDQARAKGLERLALIQLGSAGNLDDKEFSRRVVRLAIQKSVPEALRAAAGVVSAKHKDKLPNAADMCERDPTRENAMQARDAAYAATADYAACATYAAAYAAYAAYAATAAYAAADASAAASAAAAYAADAASAAADADAADARDKSLASFAEAVVQILVEMNVPGVRWLYLTEEFKPFFERQS